MLYGTGVCQRSVAVTRSVKKQLVARHLVSKLYAMHNADDRGPRALTSGMPASSEGLSRTVCQSALLLTRA